MLKALEFNGQLFHPSCIDRDDLPDAIEIDVAPNGATCIVCSEFFIDETEEVVDEEGA